MVWVEYGPFWLRIILSNFLVEDAGVEDLNVKFDSIVSLSFVNARSLRDGGKSPPLPIMMIIM